MRKLLLQYYKKIDMFSSTLLLYCLLVLIFIQIFAFLTNEYIYAILILICPIFVIIHRKIRILFNKLLHCIIRIRR